MKKLIVLILTAFLFTLSSCDIKIEKTVMYETYTDDLDYTNDNLKANGPYTKNAMPSTGDVKVLVVPVNFLSSQKTVKNRDRIIAAFSGESSSTDWCSVSEYYNISSYGKLNLTFDVTDWYTPKNSSTYYSSYEDEFDDGSTILLREVLDYYDSSYDLSEYDSDKDGYIDAVWLVYNNRSFNVGYWWAFTYVNQTEDKWDNTYARSYSFAGIDFLGDEAKVDPSTFIHETGHLFGLDDYYSYDNNVETGPLYDLDMMDQNMGDHASISKILLGWITPKVITSTNTFDILPYASDGDVYIISDHEITTIYDEYFLIDFYTGTGLDSKDKVYQISNETTLGIRVYHVDARLNLNENNEILYNGGLYSSPFYCDNTDGDEHFVELMRQANVLDNNYSGYYLYTESNNKFGLNVYKGYKLHSLKTLNFYMTVNSITDSLANVTITFD